MSSQLTTELHENIKLLCKDGDYLAESGLFSEARGKYIEALKLLPAETSNWEASTWIYAAIGDTHFQTGNFEKVMRCFTNALQCPGGLGNPYIHLRLGQAYFELGSLDRAIDDLTRAYMGGGMDIFMEDDSKYLSFLESEVEL